MELKPGTQIEGLRIERELGRGEFGVVYLAKDTLLGRRVALKVFPGRGADVPEELRDQVLTEARLIANLNNPHVVTLHRLHPTEDGGWMQEMELGEGGSLEDRLEEGKSVPLKEAVRIFRGVCLALKAAHAARILHGDIKPANVLFGVDDEVKLGDFGLARILEGVGASIDLHGRALGTPTYMAPEVIVGEQASMASDVWSAGVLLYQLLSGRLPFEAETFADLYVRIRYEEPDPLGEDVPTSLAGIVQRCLAKGVEERPPSAAALVDEVDVVGSRDLFLEMPTRLAARRTNCTPPTSAFIGRAQELGEIAELLTGDARLVTLTGPAGIGKTRLSQRLCLDLLDRFEGGCWFVDLSQVRDAQGAGHAVAETLGVPHSGEKDPVEIVSGVLEYRDSMLLVLDNFEQIVAQADTTIGAWLRRAPHVRFLVTSRALLLLDGERPYELHPLPSPSPDALAGLGPAETQTFASVRLFAERAREANPEFELDDESAFDVARICRDLEGMPLAIELAAARARVLSPSQIARKLGQKFQLLRSARRDQTARQRTLLGAIDWSYELLEDWEQEAFLQACYFRDGFSVDAVEEVIDLSRFPTAPLALDVVQGLRDKSLITAFDTGHETRLSMYGAIRDYGQHKWQETSDFKRHGALARRHAHYYLDLAEEWNARIPGRRDQEALDRIALEIGNLTAAQEWALDGSEVETAAQAALAVAETMKVRRPPGQLIPLLENSLDALGEREAGMRARLRTYLSAACQLAGDWDRAMTQADEAISTARASGAMNALADALLQQGDMLRNRGQPERALAAFAESEGIARASGDRHALALGVGERGMLLAHRGDFDAALECYRGAESIAREIGDNQTLALHITNRGVVHEWKGERETALACYREAEDISRRIGNRLRVAICVGNRANVLVQSGDAEAALHLYREAESIARELGAKQRIAQIVGYRGSVHAMRGELKEALDCFEEAESLARELGDRRGIAVMLGKRANVLASMNSTDDALACCREAESIGAEIEDRLLVAYHTCQRGTVHSKAGQLQEAWESLRQGLAMYDEMKANQSAWYFSFKATLAQVAFARGNEAAAVRLAREGLELADSLGLTDAHPSLGVRSGLAALRALVAG